MAATTVHYLAPPGSSVLVGLTAAYHPPARHHVPPAEPRVPVLVATPPRVVPEGRVSLWGTNFPPHAAVRLLLVSTDNPQGWALGTVLSGADGTLNTSVTIPQWVTDADVVRADAGGSATAQAELVVRSTVPHLKASAESGPAGTAYFPSGEGFMPGERVAVYLDSMAALPVAVTTSGDGRIALTGLRVPVAAEGNHTFVVTGTQGDIAAVSFTERAVTPFLLLSTYSSLPERPVSVSGQGFVPGEAVHLFLAGTLVGTTTADDRGALHASPAFTIPSNARGPLPVVAVGTLSGRPARTTLDVRPFERSLWLSSYAGHPGATVAQGGAALSRSSLMRSILARCPQALCPPAREGAFGVPAAGKWAVPGIAVWVPDVLCLGSPVRHNRIPPGMARPQHAAQRYSHRRTSGMCGHGGVFLPFAVRSAAVPHRTACTAVGGGGAGGTPPVGAGPARGPRSYRRGRILPQYDGPINNV